MLKEWQQYLQFPLAGKISIENLSTFPRRYQNTQQMGGVDLINQRAAAHHLDRKSAIRFYVLMFLDSMDIACANSFIFYNMTHLNDFTRLDFRTIVSTYLIGRYTSSSRLAPDGRKSSKRKYQYWFEQVNLLPHLSEFQNILSDVNIVTKKALT